jgi:hypothetical protein
MAFLNAKKIMTILMCMTVMFGNAVAQEENTTEKVVLEIVPEPTITTNTAQDDDGDYEKMTPQEIDALLNNPKRIKRLAKIDKYLEKMIKAGIIMGAYDVFGGGTGTISGAAAAAAAYGLLNVTRKSADEIRNAYKISLGENPDGITERMGCDARREQVGSTFGTIAKQSALLAGVTAGTVMAVRNAAQTKDLGDIKYGVLATRAMSLAAPEMRVQVKVMKWARNELKSCKDGGD